MRKRGLGMVSLVVFALSAAALAAQEVPPPRFADISLRILTAGPRLPTREAGAFTSTLPLGKAGGLHRLLTVTNETKNQSTSIQLGLSITPTVDEAGVLHCVVLSEAAPQGGKAKSRAKDLAFLHPGEQVMEMYMDALTETRVVLAVAASLCDEKVQTPSITFPLLSFTVRFEQCYGADREEIENINLQSLDGKSVAHDFKRKIPRWIEANAPGAEPNPYDNLQTLDFSKGTPTVKAGEGFSISLDEAQEKKGAGGDPFQKKEPDEPKEPPKRIYWEQEYCHLTLEPLSFEGDRLLLRVRASGQILDRATNLPFPPIELTAEKTLLAGQPVPFYLTREIPGGQLGYVVWVIPHWARTTPPGVPVPPPQAQPPASTPASPPVLPPASPETAPAASTEEKR